MDIELETKSKNTAIGTYATTLVCMVASLFIPFFGGTMLFQQIPSVAGEVFGFTVNTEGWWSEFTFASGLSSSFNISALAIFLYLISIVLGFIFIGPMVTACREYRMNPFRDVGREPKKLTVWAYAGESIAMLCLSLFAIDRLAYVANVGFGNANIGVSMDDAVCFLMFAMLFVIWLMFVIQSIYYKCSKSSGVAKMFLYIFSALALSMVFMSQTFFISVRLNGAMSDLVSNMNASFGFFAVDGTAVSGAGILASLGSMNTGNSTMTLLNWLALVMTVILLFNFVADTFALGTTSTHGRKVFNLIRYAVELIMALVIMIITLVASGASVGLFLYVVAILSLIQVVMSAIRISIKDAATSREAAEAKSKRYYDDEDDDEDDEVYEEGYEGFYDPDYEPEYQTEPAGYRNNGGADAFLSTLSVSERGEFYALFINKSKGNFYYMPDYTIGDDNVDFFRYLFLHLGNFIGTVSNGLINKCYAQLTALES